jgi:hypothetical protein
LRRWSLSRSHRPGSRSTSISGVEVTPSADISLTDLGMTHKAVLTFSAK